MAESIYKLFNTQFLERYGISQSELADALGAPKTTINQIVQGKRSISVEMDLKLCKYFGLEDGFFLDKQSKFMIQEMQKNIRYELDKIEPRFPVVRSKTLDEVLKVAVICGGPSQERGISMNSARSILDHLGSDNVEIYPIYMDVFGKFYEITTSQLYSNTPSDFDFKLAQDAILDRIALVTKLKEVDVVFPAIHGKFGEDGELQKLLEENDIPFVGSNSEVCANMFHKYHMSKILASEGLDYLVSEFLIVSQDQKNKEKIKDFFDTHKPQRVIVKPNAGGSSIGVFSVDSQEDVMSKVNQIFEMNLCDTAVIEPFCIGKEFTIVLVQNADGDVIPLIPTEIQMNYENHQIFDYRRKYLPTNNTIYHTPPRFGDHIIDKIRSTGKKIFQIFKMQDFARLDGWVLEDGRIVFTDLNPVSGMEQNSFLFRQAAKIGMNHGQILKFIVNSALSRYGIRQFKPQEIENIKRIEEDKKQVCVLFGGNTAERQVSLMSGTNVFLKLQKSDKYSPSAFIIDKQNYIWKLPYSYIIDHTVEEIYENCMTSQISSQRIDSMVMEIRNQLSLQEKYIPSEELPERMTFEQFLNYVKQEGMFVFLALHGGDGENGEIQQRLDAYGIQYNGSGYFGSQICIDKALTGHAVEKIGDIKIKTCPKKIISISEFKNYNDKQYQDFWCAVQDDMGVDSEDYIIKPQMDGCSSGVVRIKSIDELKKYVSFIASGVNYIPNNSFEAQKSIVELSEQNNDKYLLEKYIETDQITIEKNNLVYGQKTGWVEMTVGVMESKGVYHSLNPSITVAQESVLSLEEKFQGGTGVNLTPPPEEIVSKKACKYIKSAIEKIAKGLSIKNYARIDIFFNVITNDIIVIEANTLPGLTPSTVIYHQALAEVDSMTPLRFLEKIIATARIS